MNISYIIKMIFLALAYFVAGLLSFSLSPEQAQGQGIVTIVIFSAEGIALAAAIIYGKRVWIGVLIGQFVLAYYYGMRWEASLGIAMVNALETVLAVVLFKKLKLNKNLSTFKDIAGLILMIGLILQPISAILGNVVLVIFHIIEPSDYMTSVFRWFIGNSMGQLLVAPMLLLMNANITKNDYYKLPLVALFSIFLSYLFLEVYPISNPLLLLGVTIFFTLHLSYQIGVHYGAFTTLIVAFVSLYLTHNGMGIFVQEDSLTNIINLNSYFLFQILLVLLFGTLLSDMKNQAKTLKKLVAQEVEKNKEQQFHLLQRDRLALKGEMISMIAHQWKQPLNNLSLINQMLIMQYEGNELGKEAIEEFDEESSRQIRQMSQTITDFTNFFSPNMSKTEFFLKNIVAESLAFLKPVLFKEGIKIHVDMRWENNITLYGYPSELGQMIINIVNNAKDVLIEREIQNKKIWIIGEKVKGKIHLSIEDNAGGISIELLGKIFDPYFSTKAKNGTGLGLYMSKMIIEEHMNGHLLVSNSEHGAKFEVILPI